MESIPSTLIRASERALADLGDVARRVALPAGGGAERWAAGAARSAVFADALLAAMHARLEELHGVAK